MRAGPLISGVPARGCCVCVGFYICLDTLGPEPRGVCVHSPGWPRPLRITRVPTRPWPASRTRPHLVDLVRAGGRVGAGGNWVVLRAQWQTSRACVPGTPVAAERVMRKSVRCNRRRHGTAGARGAAQRWLFASACCFAWQGTNWTPASIGRRARAAHAHLAVAVIEGKGPVAHDLPVLGGGRVGGHLDERGAVVELLRARTRTRANARRQAGLGTLMSAVLNSCRRARSPRPPRRAVHYCAHTHWPWRPAQRSAHVAVGPLPERSASALILSVCPAAAVGEAITRTHPGAQRPTRPGLGWHLARGSSCSGPYY